MTSRSDDGGTASLHHRRRGSRARVRCPEVAGMEQEPPVR